MVKRETTGEKMVRMETKLEAISEQIHENKVEHGRIFTVLDEIKESHQEFINTSNDKYATKKELDDVKKEINTDKAVSRGWIQSSVPWVLSVATFVAGSLLSYFIWRGGSP